MPTLPPPYPLPTPKPIAARKRRRGAIATAVVCWAYLVSVALFIVVIRILGDRTWQGTLLIFAPRWPALCPLIVFVPAAALLNRKMLLVLLLTAIITVFPLMGLNVGPLPFARQKAVGMPIRVLAYNVHRDRLAGPRATRFFADTNADVVALEELPGDFNRSLFPELQWHVEQHDEIALASRFPIRASRDLWGDAATQFWVITPAGEIEIIVVHLSSPHYALQDAVLGNDTGVEELQQNIHNRTQQAAILGKIADATAGPLIIAGDFNLTFDSCRLRNNFAGMTDSFDAVGRGFGLTYQNRWTEVRIDHVLTNSYFQPQHFSRGPLLYSPHYPIVSDLILKPRI